MNLVTLDIETYFDDDYTLSKMTTEEYVRDKRFKAHCVGLKAGAGQAEVRGQDYMHGSCPLSVGDSAVLCHHAHFDGLILSHHYGVKPAFWFDTLSMARLVLPHAKSHSLGSLAQELGLGAKTIDYTSFKGVRDLSPEQYRHVAAGCADDVELTYRIFRKLLPYVPKTELRVIDMTVRMFTEPALVLDRPLMEWYTAALGRRKEEKLAQLGVTAKDLGSNDRFAVILRSLGVEPSMKISPTAKLSPEGKPTLIYAFAKTDQFMRELLEDEDETVALLAEARLETKSTGTQTRAQRLLDMDTRGPLCVYINHAGAHTLRDSGGDSMNWQNFKRIDFQADGKTPVEGVEQRGTVRLAIKAPPGQVLVVVDASQIEYRFLCWAADQQDKLDKLARNESIYEEIATQFYGRPITRKDKAERGTGKQLTLSCGFGAGAETIVRTARLGIHGPPVVLSLEEGLRARDVYRSAHPMVVRLWEEATAALAQLHAGTTWSWRPGVLEIENKRIHGPDGTWLDYSNLHWDQVDREWYVLGRRGRSKMYGAKLVENVIQWLARAFLMAKAWKIGAAYKIVMRTHDELVYLADAMPYMAGYALDFGLVQMKTPEAWCPGIPLDAEGGHDVRYSK